MSAEYWTKQDLSRELKIPERTVDYLVSTNQIPFSRIGKRSVRFSSERINEWFNEREGVELRYKTKNKK
jgi:excisionase family DNA binding protein